MKYKITLVGGPMDGDKFAAEVLGTCIVKRIMLPRCTSFLGYAQAVYEWTEIDGENCTAEFVAFQNSRGERLRKDGSLMPLQKRKRRRAST